MTLVRIYLNLITASIKQMHRFSRISSQYYWWTRRDNLNVQQPGWIIQTAYNHTMGKSTATNVGLRKTAKWHNKILTLRFIKMMCWDSFWQERKKCRYKEWKTSISDKFMISLSVSDSWQKFFFFLICLYFLIYFCNREKQFSKYLHADEIHRTRYWFRVKLSI